MNNKIIGFTISKYEIDHADVDIFGVGLSQDKLFHSGFYIYIWGIGDLKKCFLDQNIFSLSFPLHNSLLDRNVIVILDKNKITVENDWLGSIPIFYNTQTQIVSTLINKTINKKGLEIDPEGFNNYLDFGYSILERTPIKYVNFLRYYSLIILDVNNFHIEKKQDPIENQSSKEISPKEVVEKISNYISEAENKVMGEIIIPTSGGFDSRFLNSLISDKKRIRSFTYGVSKNQVDSSEVVKARKLSEILHTKWEHIPIINFNRHVTSWHKIFGPSTHLHGMYHIDFFSALKNKVTKNATLLSGIIGDAWSGGVKIEAIEVRNHHQKIGYSHGINIDSKYSLLKSKNILKEFVALNDKNLDSRIWRIVISMRFKLVLLSYLNTIPEYFGWPAWTPFLNMDNVLSTLNLPQTETEGRKWQKNYFKSKGIMIEDFNLTYTKEKRLDAELLKIDPLPTLNVDLLGEYLDQNFLKKTNKEFLRLVNGGKGFHTFPYNQFGKKGISRILWWFGIKDRDVLKPYYNILIIKSIEMLLKD